MNELSEALKKLEQAIKDALLPFIEAFNAIGSIIQSEQTEQKLSRQQWIDQRMNKRSRWESRLTMKPAEDVVCINLYKHGKAKKQHWIHT